MNNKDIRTNLYVVMVSLIVNFEYISQIHCVCIVCFEQVNVGWVTKKCS